MSAQITLDTQIEDLVRDFPEAVGFLTRHGIRCIRCGEPLWSSLGELLDQDCVDDPHQLVTELNEFLKRK